MASSSAGYGGSLGGRFALVLVVDEISVDTPNNRSLIQVTAYMTCVTNAGHVFNFAQTPATIYIDGGAYGRSTSYDFNPGVGSVYYLMNAEQFWIGHNTDGTRSVYVEVDHDAQDSPYVTNSATGFTLGLTTINRFASITSFSASSITDVSFQFTVNVSDTCNLLEYSLDSGATWHSVSGTFTSQNVTLSNLRSATTYTTRVRVTDAASGLTTTSGDISTTTLAQNNFLLFL